MCSHHLWGCHLQPWGNNWRQNNSVPGHNQSGSISKDLEKLCTEFIMATYFSQVQILEKLTMLMCRVSCQFTCQGLLDSWKNHSSHNNHVFYLICWQYFSGFKILTCFILSSENTVHALPSTWCVLSWVSHQFLWYLLCKLLQGREDLFIFPGVSKTKCKE